MPKEKSFSLLLLAEVLLLFVLSLPALSGFSLLSSLLPVRLAVTGEEDTSKASDTSKEKTFIHWVDFTVTCEAMNQALALDCESFGKEPHLNWIELLAYLGAKYGGDFSRYKENDMRKLADRLRAGEVLEEITADMKYYSYYLEAYEAVLGGMVGEPTAMPSVLSHPSYGLLACSPIAKGFPYSEFDDFGVSRSYGFRRQHLGHDMMGQVGTPIIAVESGTVEALGWNQYGGWRIGIRSFDKKRYYYYAHLRKNYPYQSNLKEGCTVQAGDVIGYMGRTGYSRTENTNNIEESHLHFGLQLIFDESQKEGNNEIWISCYELVKFLHQHQISVEKVEGTKEWKRIVR